MARPIKQKAEVLRLREQGNSIRDISLMYDLPKSTVSYWCRDIQMSKAHTQALKEKCRKAGTAKCIELAEKKRAERIRRVEQRSREGARRIGSLTKRDLFLLGLGLYWGEGYKHESDGLGFTNSDPRMIKTYLAWIERIYGVDTEDIVLRVSINEVHRSREKSVLRYWSRLTGIPLSRFTKTSFIKTRARKDYPNQETHYGTLRVKVRRSSALRHQTMGAIARISETFKA